MAKKVDSTKTVETGQGVFDVRAYGLGQVHKAAAPQSNVENPFESMYGGVGARVLAPPFEPLALFKIREMCQPLSDCIQTMVTNVDGFGYELAPAPHLDENSIKEPPPEAVQEKRLVSTLLDYCNRLQSVTLLRQELRDDLETTGNACIEVVPTRAGDIAELHRLPSHSVRLTAQDAEWTEFDDPIRTADGKYEARRSACRFRRIVQIINGQEKVYFKEFGDPRPISKRTGKVIGAGNAKELAHEVVWFSIHCGSSPYGVPRWIGCLLGIMGSRKAEEVNYLFFDNKTIPPLVVTVSGGNLTKDTIKKLTEVFEREIKGVQNFHKALILEATPHAAADPMGGEKVVPVRIEVKPLTEHIDKDARFLEYLNTNAKAIRQAFRLPPNFLGGTEDLTKATAREATLLGEEQVFVPERNKFDYIIERTLMARMQINNWVFKSLGANTSDDAELLTAVSAVKEAIPVGILMEMVAKVRNVPVGEIDRRWYDLPLGLLGWGAGTDEEGAESEPGDSEKPKPKEKPEDDDEEPEVEKFIDKMMDLREKLLKRVDAQAVN